LASTGGTGEYVLTAHDPGSGYAPTFTGNGELGDAHPDPTHVRER
jgi:hypothetical protein